MRRIKPKLFSKRIVRHLSEHDEKISKEIIDLLFNYDKRIKSTTIKGYVIKGVRGRAYTEHGQFTVPNWTFVRGAGYFTYYVAHELAHIIAARKYSGAAIHDKYFYKVFCKLCPKDLQHYEIDYKKRSSRFGVKEK